MEPQNISQNTIQKLPKAWVIFKQSILFFKNNFEIIAIISIIPFIFDLLNILQILPTSSPLWSLCVGVSSYLTTLALLYIFTKTPDTQNSFETIYKGTLPYIIPALWIGALVSLASLSGLVLFVFPGLLVSLLLTLSVYSLFVENKKGVLALVQSWHYVSGYMLQLIGKILFLGLVIMFPIVVVTILSMPFGHTVKNQLTGETSIILPLYSQIILQLFATVIVTPISLIYSLNIFKLLATIKGLPSAERIVAIRKKVYVFIVIGVLALVGILVLVGLLATHVVKGNIKLPTAYRTAAAFAAFNPIFNFLK